MKDSFEPNDEIFRKVFVMSPDAVNVNRLSDGLYILVNDGFTNITGFTEEEVIGKTSLELNLWADPELSEWETGEGRFFTGIVRDVTERKKMK